MKNVLKFKQLLALIGIISGLIPAVSQAKSLVCNTMEFIEKGPLDDSPSPVKPLIMGPPTASILGGGQQALPVRQISKTRFEIGPMPDNTFIAVVNFTSSNGTKFGVYYQYNRITHVDPVTQKYETELDDHFEINFSATVDGKEITTVIANQKSTAHLGFTIDHTVTIVDCAAVDSAGGT